MSAPQPLEPATLVRRYRRFLADVELADGSLRTVHCPNPGRMLGCSAPGSPVLLSDSGDPRRKLRWTLERVRVGRSWVGVNPLRANGVVEALVRRGRIAELAGYRRVRREVAYGRGGRSRIDLLLSAPGRPDCYLEVKSVTYRVGEHAAFPDAVTARGKRHLEELAEVVAQGGRGVIFFLVARGDCRRLRPADEIDPAYGDALRRAVDAGVEALAYRFRLSRRIRCLGPLPLDL